MSYFVEIDCAQVNRFSTTRKFGFFPKRLQKQEPMIHSLQSPSGMHKSHTRELEKLKRQVKYFGHTKRQALLLNPYWRGKWTKRWARGRQWYKGEDNSKRWMKSSLLGCTIKARDNGGDAANFHSGEIWLVGSDYKRDLLSSSSKKSWYSLSLIKLSEEHVIQCSL